MSNSQNENLECVSNGNNESMANEDIGSTSNKKTRFNKSKSISEVFKELDSQDELSFDATDSIADAEFEDIGSVSDAEESILDSAEGADLNSVGESILDSAEGTDLSSAEGSHLSSTEDIELEEEMDEIIPIHNEYGDLDESEAFNADSIYEDDEKSSDLDNYVESIVNESDNFDSNDYAGSKENLGAISGYDSSLGGEDNSIYEDINVGDSIGAKDLNQSVEEDKEELKAIKVNRKPSSDGVFLNKNQESVSSKVNIEWDSSMIITILSFIVGIGIFIMGILYYNTSSDRVVDNVLSGETAGLAVFLIIIGLLIIGFSILRFITAVRPDQSSSMLDMFNSIRDIDYDDVKEDNISRDDFDSIFSNVLGKEKRSNFSDDEKNSVDKNSDLFEKDEKLSDEDIESLYSKSNIKSQKNTSSFKKQNANDSTEDSIDFDNFIDDDTGDFDSIAAGFDSGVGEESVGAGFDSGVGEESVDEGFNDTSMIDTSSKGDKMSNLKDKYSKYNFDDADNLDDSKPQFKKSVDISKFNKENLSEEELEAERKRKKEELEEKKRRIIQGTNFDNSLRK